MGKSTKPSCCHGDWPLVFPTKHVWHTSAGGFFRQNSKQMGWSRIRPCLCLRCQLFLTISWKWTHPNQNATPINSGDTQTHLVAKNVKSPFHCSEECSSPFRQCHDWEQSYHYDNSKKDSCIDPAMVHIDLIPTNKHRHLGLLVHRPILDGIFTKLVQDVQVHSSRQYTSANGVRHLGLIQ